MADRGESFGRDATRHQRSHHGSGARFGQRLRVPLAARRVAMHRHVPYLFVRDQDLRDRIQDRRGAWTDLRLVRVEVDVVENLDAVVDEEDTALVGTAVFVVAAVVGLRLAGAPIVDVEDAVAVVVGVGAAVAVFEAIHVFRLERARVA